MVQLLKHLVALASLAYPLAVFAGLPHLEPKSMALVLLVLALLRAALAREVFWWAAAAGAALLAASSAFGNALLPLKLYPVLVNAVLLGVFCASLKYPPTVVERLARMAEPQLPDAALPYVRRVTQAWCLFFIGNGGIALATALWASNAAWAFYTGFFSYVLMGVFFAVEWLVRRRVRSRIAAEAKGLLTL